MANVKQTVTRTENGVDTTGAANVRRTSTRTETSADGRTVAVNAVWFIFGVITILLALRFILKLAGANPNNGFVDFVYSVSGVLSAPFDTIFGVTSATAGRVHSVFEPSILVAIAVYALIAWGIARLLHLDRPTDEI